MRSYSYSTKIFLYSVRTFLLRNAVSSPKYSLLCQLIRDIINMAYYNSMIFQIFIPIDCLNVDHSYLLSKFLSFGSEKCSCRFLLILASCRFFCQYQRGSINITGLNKLGHTEYRAFLLCIYFDITTFKLFYIK